MTTRDIFLSVLIGLVIGTLFSACFIFGVERGLDYRDAETCIDSRAIIGEALHGN